MIVEAQVTIWAAITAIENAAEIIRGGREGPDRAIEAGTALCRT